MREMIDDWVSSGLAHLTGAPDGPPDLSGAPILARARDVAADVTRLSRTMGRAVDVDAAVELAGRAGSRGGRRQGRVSVGGASRLVHAADGWCAFTLSRPDDVAAVPALLLSDDLSSPDDPCSPDDAAQVERAWTALERVATSWTVDELVGRGSLLGIPCAKLVEAAASEPRRSRMGMSQTSPRSRTGERTRPLVVDLTSMWAGPLAGRILRRAGADVIKVESPVRPDGTRAGNTRFFEWVNAGKLSAAVDFNSGAALIGELIDAADIVLEASRPGSLVRHGLDASQREWRPGKVWLRITGHADDDLRVAFGDDAAAAGGLVGHGPVFCGDAIADPLTGLTGAAAVLDSVVGGGGELIDIALSSVAAGYARAILPDTATAKERPGRVPPPAPLPSPREPAPKLGADTARAFELARAHESARAQC